MKLGSSDKNGTIGTKVLFGTVLTVFAVILIVGFFSYTKVAAVDKARYEDKIQNTVITTDAALDAFLGKIESLANSFVNINLIYGR